MPTVSLDRGFRFFFYSNEGLPREAVHIHVEKDDVEAKFWLRPEVKLAYNGDTNVMNSPVVNAAVLCVLVLSGNNPACVQPGSGLGDQQVKAEKQSLQNNEPEPTKTHIFLANDRIAIVAPSTYFKLAEENELSFGIQGPGLVEVETDQAQYSTDDLQTRKLPPTRPEGGYAILPILYHSDGSPYIKVVPRRLGKIVLELRASFSDGGFTKTDVTVDVVPPPRSPQKLFVSEDGFTGYGVIYTYLKPESDRHWLAVSAAYGGVKEPVLIYPSFATFKIRTANDASVISLDAATGSITPLQPGEALVKTTFGRKTALTCVVVTEENDPNHTGPPQTCKSLLLPGESLATSTIGRNTP
jgi:hypothetical protein